MNNNTYIAYKSLTDSEILNWNNKFEDSYYSLAPVYSEDLSINVKIFPNYKYSQRNYITDFKIPIIKHIFIFSVSKNKKDDFFMILNKLFKDYHFSSKVIINNNIFNIKIDNSIINSIDQTEHLFNKISFIKYKYEFMGEVSSIISYISYLEDAINCFQKIWGYNEDGKELNLLKYNIGDIVSLKGNKSKDFLILDYNFLKLIGQNNFEIKYSISEMLFDFKSGIIKYDKIIECDENELCYSRNSRIDDILN